VLPRFLLHHRVWVHTLFGRNGFLVLWGDIGRSLHGMHGRHLQQRWSHELQLVWRRGLQCCRILILHVMRPWNIFVLCRSLFI
jgi:hypothetical protein